MYDIIIQWIKDNRNDLNIWFEKSFWDYKRNDIFIIRLDIKTDLNYKEIENFFKPLFQLYIWCKIDKWRKSKYSKLNNYLVEVWYFI